MGWSYHVGASHSIPQAIHEQEDSNHFTSASVFKQQSQKEESQAAQRSSSKDTR
jgi:hypothetical protein